MSAPASTVRYRAFQASRAELEAAFPDRFIRMNASASSSSVDFRPVNYDQARRDTIRWGFDFSKPLRSARPSQAAIERFRARRAAETGSRVPSPGRQDLRLSGTPSPESGPPPDGAGPPPGGPGGGGGFGRGGGGFGRFGGGRQGGRLQFSLTHTLNLVDEVTIRRGLPELDYLNGDARRIDRRTTSARA